MELSVPDWLIVIGAVLIVAVLLDAARRYRSERRNPIRMGKGSMGMGGGFPRDELDPSSSELPGGRARVVRTREAPDEERVAKRPSARVEPSLDDGTAAALTGVQSADTPLVADPRGVTAGKSRQAGAGDVQQEVLVIHVLARSAGGFAGAALLEILKLCDVRLGEQRIFNRFEEEKGQGAVQFSIVNAVEPGVFDPDQLETLTTPGLGFFMRLPGPLKPLEAFDCMLETARSIAKNLDGELQDESHSVFTPQTVEHCRQRVRDFVHRSRARA